MLPQIYILTRILSAMLFYNVNNFANFSDHPKQLLFSMFSNNRRLPGYASSK